MAARLETQAEPIPGYRLLERLGGGGFGEVWKAEAPGGLLKAIKFVYGDLETVDPQDAARAEQELKSLNRVKRIRHPFILSLERADIVDGQLIIVMELADRSMWDRYKYCRSKGLPGIPRDELLKYLYETADALDYMNFDEDLLHLDIKPQNLFLVHNHVKIADFGLVKDLQGLVASVTGGVTPVYAAPESFDGYVSRYSDQYSLAIVYQELLTGQRPFTGTTTRQLILQHLQTQPDLSGLPEHDQDLVARALSKDPNERHHRSLEFIEGLRAAGRSGRRYAVVDPPAIADTTPDTPQVTPQPPSAEERIPALEDLPATKVVPPPDVVAQLTPPSRVNVTPPERQDVAGMSEATFGRSAQPKPSSDGILLPALVIGIGDMGRLALQHLRKQLELRHGDLAELPHLRLLAMDTDPELSSLAVATKGNEELLTVRLNRPHRYLRPKDTMTPPEDWLDTMMVYRIPRNPATAGIRALGRLAFVDHYRLISARVRRELQQITAPESLSSAARHTGLGIRTSWPRVMIVTSLAGGTGSGMFLDLAYLVRSQLREIGYSKPDLAGVFFLPEGHSDETHNDLRLANTYAALLELHHFSQPGKNFVGRYDTKLPRVEDANSPFGRCTLLAAAATALSSVTATAADAIYRELMTPLGQAMDVARSRRHTSAAEAQQLDFSTFGTRVLAAPYLNLVRRSAERLCADLVGLWMNKDASHLLPALRQDVLEVFRRHRLDSTGLSEQLQAALTADLGEPLDKRLTDWFNPPRPTQGESANDLQHTHGMLNRVEELLGPVEESESLRPSQVRAVLRDSAEQITRHVEPLLIRDLNTFLDKPGVRLGGTEEAYRQGLALIEEWLALAELEAEKISHTLSVTADRLKVELAEAERHRQGSRFRWSGQLPNLPATALRYAQLRSHHILTQRMLGCYLSMRGRLSDQIKEMRYSRIRFGELHGMFQSHEPLAAPDAEVPFLPFGCRTIQAVGAHVRKSITDVDFRALDAAVQERLASHVGKLSQISVVQTPQLRQMATVILQEGERFVKARLPSQDVSELFLQRHPEGPDRLEALNSAYDSARPELTVQPSPRMEVVNYVVAPTTESGRQFVQQVCTQVTRLKPILSPKNDEIVFYREYQRLELQGLEHFGVTARAAYELSRSVEHFTPHARQDIHLWTEPS